MYRDNFIFTSTSKYLGGNNGFFPPYIIFSPQLSPDIAISIHKKDKVASSMHRPTTYMNTLNFATTPTKDNYVKCEYQQLCIQFCSDII
jgi:hypothetical protein